MSPHGPGGMGATASAYKSYADEITDSPIARAVAAATPAHLRRFWDKTEASDDGCLVWTRRRFPNGYGCFKIAGSNVGAHRFILWFVAGPPSSVGLQAAHSCGNPPCVNPGHLRWADNFENMGDAVAHGTIARGIRSGLAKLTDGQVQEIRTAYAAGGVTQSQLGRKYGVDQTQISRVVRRQTWTHLANEVAS